jgi:iron complex outermembrane recepter protein
MKTLRESKWLLLPAAAVFGTALLGAPAAEAQVTGTSTSAADDNVIGEIVVTAQRREEREKDVPITITTISGDALAQNDARQLSDIVSLTPGLRFDASGPFVQPTIRGVGTAVSDSGSGSNVGIYIDGFYAPNPLSADTQLMNVQSVQVLKGPQGTLFGRNTTGGAILLNTAKPSQDTSATFQVSYGRFNSQQYEGYATTGITSKLAVDVEAIDNRGDGFQRNIATGDNHTGSYDNWSLRLGAKFDATDTLSFLLRYQHSATNDPASELGTVAIINGTPASAGILIPGTIFPTNPSSVAGTSVSTFNNKSNVLQLTSALTLPFATLTSYSQGRWEQGQSFLNQDYSSASFFQLSIPVYNRTLTQELLFASTGDSKLQWTTGLFFFDNSDQWEDIKLSVLKAPLTSFTGSGTDTRSSAAYVDATYEVVPRLFLTAGVRYSHDEVLDPFFRNVVGGVPIRTDVPEIKTNTVTPRAVVRYKPDDASSVYFSFSKGYKAPIVNVGGGTLDGINVASEGIKAYELGYKYGRGPLSFDAAVYHYDYTNLQVASYIGTASLINNAASAKINGAEISSTYRPFQPLTFNVGAAYTHAVYGRYPDATFYSQCLNAAACGAGYGLFAVQSGDASGNQMQRAPTLTGNLGARYQFDLFNGEFAVSGNAYHTSTVEFQASNQFKQDAYTTLTLRAEWTDPTKRYTVAVYGDNVTDKRYITEVQTGNFGIGYVWNAPAMFGVQAKIHF